jgi:lysozyme family protein
MNLCQQGVRFTKINEGGFSNHPQDKGGPTNLGVTLKTLREVSASVHGHSFDKDQDGDIDVVDLKNLDDADLAIVVTAGGFWNPLFDQMDPKVAIKTFDFGFNCGVRSGIKLLQQAVNLTAGKELCAVDGSMGPKTLACVQSLSCGVLLRNLVNVAKQHYCDIVRHDPSQVVFLHGWMRRADRMPVLV